MIDNIVTTRRINLKACPRNIIFICFYVYMYLIIILG